MSNEALSQLPHKLATLIKCLPQAPFREHLAAECIKQSERIAELEAELLKRHQRLHDTEELAGQYLAQRDDATAERDQLRAEVERLRADGERLDHIEKRARCDPKMDGQHVWWPTSFNQALKGPTLRAAIDAARTHKETK